MAEELLPEFMWMPLLVASLLSVVLAPLGAFVVWRRLAYFGDTLSHSGLLGVTMGILLGLPLSGGILFVAVSVAVLFSLLQNRGNVPNDSVLGILSHTALALGIILVASMTATRVDLLSFLYGDVLTVKLGDLYLAAGLGVLTWTVLHLCWRPLILMCVHTELAMVEGVLVESLNLVLNILIAAAIAVAIKIVGALLATAMMIIPLAGARLISGSPRQMIAAGMMMGQISVLLGFLLSVYWDVPTGPMMIVCSAAIYLVSVVTASTPENHSEASGGDR